MAEISEIAFEYADQCNMYGVCTYSGYCCIFKGDIHWTVGQMLDFIMSEVFTPFLKHERCLKVSLIYLYICVCVCVTKLTNGFQLLVIQGDIFTTPWLNVKTDF